MHVSFDTNGSPVLGVLTLVFFSLLCTLSEYFYKMQRFPLEYSSICQYWSMCGLICDVTRETFMPHVGVQCTAPLTCFGCFCVQRPNFLYFLRSDNEQARVT